MNLKLVFTDFISLCKMENLKSKDPLHGNTLQKIVEQ
jgi:uncharacterized protein (DUF2132 family)